VGEFLIECLDTQFSVVKSISEDNIQVGNTHYLISLLKNIY